MDKERFDPEELTEEEELLILLEDDMVDELDFDDDDN